MNQTSVRNTVPTTTFTRWTNPTNHVQRVILNGQNGPFKFELQPGETRELDSIYDRAIQMVDCGRDECHHKRAGGWYCAAGHPGSIQGGLAPLLRRLGKEDTLDPTLDPALASKKLREAALAADAMVQKAREQALVVAANKLDEEETQQALALERTRIARQAAAKAAAIEEGTPAAFAAQDVLGGIKASDASVPGKSQQSPPKGRTPRQ